MSTSPASRETGAAEPETKDLAGRRALVSGGTRGMGAAIAQLLVARGAHVIVTARHREDSESPVRLIQADLASPEGADFAASEANAACARRRQPHDRTDRRRLAHAVTAHQRDHLALPNRERQTEQHLAEAVAGLDIVDLEQRCCISHG